VRISKIKPEERKVAISISIKAKDIEFCQKNGIGLSSVVQKVFDEVNQKKYDTTLRQVFTSITQNKTQ